MPLVVVVTHQNSEETSEKSSSEEMFDHEELTPRSGELALDEDGEAKKEEGRLRGEKRGERGGGSGGGGGRGGERGGRSEKEGCVARNFATSAGRRQRSSAQRVVW